MSEDEKKSQESSENGAIKRIKEFFNDHPEYANCSRHEGLKQILQSNMTIVEEYQTFTPTTAGYPKEYELEYLALELCNEAGEVAGKIKKNLRGDSNYQDPDKLKAAVLAELGDVLYPISQLCNYFDISIEELMHLNMTKLKGRTEKGTIKGDGDSR